MGGGALRLVVLCALLLVPLFTQGIPAVDAATTAEVIAHRGASRVAPENTLAAISEALRVGSDVVEVDVRLTADGALVLMHDATLERTTDAEQRYPKREPWHVGDFTLAELRELDAGAWKHARFAGERVPTLGDALAAVEGRAGLLIELKDPRRDLAMEAKVAEHISADGTATGSPDPRHDVSVQSFDYLAIARFAALQPDVPVAVLEAMRPSPAKLDVYSRFADGVAPPHRAVDRSLVEAIQSRGMRVTPYTVNDRPTMRRLLGLGVDGVVSDVPRRLHKVRAASS